MHAFILRPTARAALLTRRTCGIPSLRRWNSSITEKYADKVKRRLEAEGVSSVADFKKKLEPTPPTPTPLPPKAEPSQTAQRKVEKAPWPEQPRQDASPVIPLSHFMDLGRIFGTPHSPNDIAAIWTAYHAAKTGGTGRGYVSAVVPVAAYEQLMGVASKFPTFVVPLQRPAPPEAPEGTDAHEFFYLQWSVYDAPRRLDQGVESNPRVSTAIFTSLAEYKLRQEFAQPHLALTFHTELARSHGLVLMRGELTPSSAGADKFVLSQEDAQTLCVLMQKFFLPAMREETQEDLLRVFHERPQDFGWEELIRQSKLY